MSLLQRSLAWTKALLLVGAFAFGLVLIWGAVFVFSALLQFSDQYQVVVPTVITAPFGIVGTYWLLRRLTARRERTIIAVTVALWLVIVLPVLAMPEEEFQTEPQPDPDADFSGFVKSPDGNHHDSHEVNLSVNDTVRMEFDSETGGGVLWTIYGPHGNKTRGGMGGQMPDGARKTDDNDVIYTAPQDGVYRITISADTYSKTAYEIYIEDS